MCVLAGFRARRQRIRVLALFAWLLVAQTLLIVHRIDHASAGHEPACALCVAADHVAGPIAAPIHAIAHSSPPPLATHAVEHSAPSVFVPSYRSRAPPASLRS
ncbi:MAG TPA: hypothetical protein VFJ95_16240 [Gammaproteobacteria bacterium]|nr:hypothetical protein [Gammaproteobacteria bacterium]